VQITGTQIIQAPTATVWAALNDPEVLRACLPGCEQVIRETPDRFKIVMTAAVGPLKARFNGLLHITEAEPPTRCVMVFEGQGGAMGFGKGSSTVSLRDVDGGTQLEYAAAAQVGGKMAQVGSRMIDSVARKMSDDFFGLLRKRLAPVEQVPAVQSDAASQSDAGVALVDAAVAAQASPTLAAAVPASATRAEPAVRARSAAAHTAQPSERRSPQVPAWWLFPAVAFGALMSLLVLRLGT
jgi:uncharacterized protein